MPDCSNAPSQGRLLVPYIAFAVFTIGSATACNRDAQGANGQAPPPPEVGVVTLAAEPVALTSELAGRTVAYEVSEVRPQVAGIIRRRLFTEGAAVQQGEVLYEIDPQVHQAAVQQARANLASAEAAAVAAKSRADRVNSLVDLEAISQQDRTEAISAAAQAAAAVEQARAALRTAEINLGYTRITAPISGRISRSLVTTGALVTAAQPQPLATIQRLDPIFVDVQQSATRLLELRRALSAGGVTPTRAQVHLRLEDGNAYPHTGTLEFTEMSVDQSTGTVVMRARFPNAQGVLLPGMYVRATVGQVEAKNAILAPQQGVMRNPRGEATAYVVSGDTIEVRALTLGRTVGDRWLVTEGLNAGDQLVVEGTSRVRPGQPVRPVPAGNGAGADSAQGHSAAQQQ